MLLQYKEVSTPSFLVESKVLSTEQLQENELFVSQQPLYNDLEENYDLFHNQFLGYLQSAVRPQHVNYELTEAVCKASKLLRTEEKVEGCETVLLIQTLLGQIKVIPKQKKNDVNEQKWIQLCLEEVRRTYELIYEQFRLSKDRVKKLHSLHCSILTEKWKKATVTLQREYQETDHECSIVKNKWTAQCETTWAKWRNQQVQFRKSIFQWLDQFQSHQEAVLRLGSDNVLPVDTFHAFQAIGVQTSKIREHINNLTQDMESSTCIHMENLTPIDNQSYLEFLIKFYAYWMQLETQYRPVLQAEIRNLEGKCQKKLKELQVEHDRLKQLQQSLQINEQELAHLHELSAEDKQLNRSRLESSLSLKQTIAYLQPKYQESRQLINKLQNEYNELKDRNRLIHSKLPEKSVLRCLVTYEKDLVQKRQKKHQEAAEALQTLQVDWKQKKDYANDKFGYYLTRHFQLAHEERRKFEWQEWGKLEQYMKQAEPLTQILRKTLLRYQTGCTQLFSKDGYEKLINHLQDAWRHLLQTYIHVRMAQQIAHLQQLQMFYSSCVFTC